ncbi:MAG: hemolysin family protein [Sciscionella sp.]
MNIPLSLLLTVLLLAGNAFFVGAEFAVITARRDRLEALAEAGKQRARAAIRAGQELPLLIAGAQLGVTVCTLLLGALSEPAISAVIEHPFQLMGVPGVVVHAIGFVIAVGIVTTLHTMLGEMVPKNVAIAGPERAAMWLVPVHFAFCRLTRPLLNLFTTLSRAVLRLLRVRPKDELETAYTPDEIANLISESRQQGLLQDSEHRRLAKALSSAARTVADVLVPLAQLTTLRAAPTVGDVEAAVVATGFSRFPVRAADGVGLVGYLHVKDVLDQVGAAPETPVPAERIRGLPVVAVGAKLDAALSALRRERSHLATAIGAGGAVLGVVAMEDLVEEYVGTVRDGTHMENSA